AVVACKRASQGDDVLEHRAEARPIDGHLLDHLQLSQVRLQADELISAPLQRRPKPRKRRVGAPEFKSRRTHPRARRDLDTEITNGFRRKDDRRQLGEAVALDCERKAEHLCGTASNALEAGNILGHEIEITATLAVLLRNVARRTGYAGHILADSLEKPAVSPRAFGCKQSTGRHQLVFAGLRLEKQDRKRNRSLQQRDIDPGMDKKLAPVRSIANQAARRVARADHRVGFIVVDLLAADIKVIQDHEVAFPPRRSKRSNLLLPAAGPGGDEVLRSRGEKVELRQLQRAQRRCEGGNAFNGEPPAQASNGGLVLGTGVARRGDLKARIAEEAMDDFAERLAGLEIGNNGGVKLKGASLDHTSRGSVAQRQVARERDRIIIPRPFRYRVQTAIAHRITVGLEAALLPDLRKPGVRRRNASEGA